VVDYRNKFLTKASTHNVSIPLLEFVDYRADRQFYSHYQENQAVVPIDGRFMRSIIVLCFQGLYNYRRNTVP